MSKEKKTALAVILMSILVAMYLYAPTGTSVSGSPHLTPGQINSVLCASHSPTCGDGQALYDGAKEYQIDARYALATFKIESGYGLYGIAATTHGLGNIRCTPGYSCYQGFRYYPNWSSGFNDFYQLIRNTYITKWHLSTVETIVPDYAPSNENDTAKYIANVIAAMGSYK